jgi:hypothetical protein
MLQKGISESLLVPRNGIASYFLFQGIVRNGIREIALFLLHITEFRAFFSSVEWFGTKFREFASILFHCRKFREFSSSTGWFGTEFREFSVPRNSRNSTGTNQLFRLFRLPGDNLFVRNCQP